MSASDGQDSNGNTDLILSGLTKIFSGTCQTAAGLGGVAVGSFASGVLVADNATGVLTFDDAALFVTVPFTAASGKYAFNGSREAVDGLTELTVGVVGTARTLGTWIGDKAKSALDNISKTITDATTQSKTNSDKLIPLYRAVSSAEHESIQRTGSFSNPNGIEGKYFSITQWGAEHEGKFLPKLEKSNDVYKLYETSISQTAITPDMIVSVDGGIDTVYVPTEKLPLLSPPKFLKNIE